VRSWILELRSNKTQKQTKCGSNIKLIREERMKTPLPIDNCKYVIY
jgi:hypothetical protein